MYCAEFSFSLVLPYIIYFTLIIYRSLFDLCSSNGLTATTPKNSRNFFIVFGAERLLFHFQFWWTQFKYSLVFHHLYLMSPLFDRKPLTSRSIADNKLFSSLLFFVGLVCVKLFILCIIIFNLYYIIKLLTKAQPNERL